MERFEQLKNVPKCKTQIMHFGS